MLLILIMCIERLNNGIEPTTSGINPSLKSPRDKEKEIKSYDLRWRCEPLTINQRPLSILGNYKLRFIVDKVYEDS